MRNFIRSALSTLLFVASIVAQVAKPPAAPVRPVTDDYYGNKVTDNYRWMEDMKSPELKEWMTAQNDYTRSLLDAIPGRGQLLADITKYDNARTIVDSLQVYNGRLFYRKIPSGEENYKLYVRDTKGGPERMLVDPEAFRPAGSKAHYALDYFAASWDGKYVAFGVSPGGSEQSVLRVMDVDSGKNLPEAIDRANFGVTSWLGDSHSFFYIRLQEMGPNDPPTAKYLNARVYLHKLGDDPAKDIAELGRGVTPQVEIGESDFPILYYSPASPWLVAMLRHGVQNEFPVYVAKLSDLAGAKTPWTKAAGDEDDVNSVDVHDNWLYLMTHRDASRYKVVVTDMAHPDFASAKTLLAQSEIVLRNIAAAKDGLYVQELDGGIGKVVRVPFPGGNPESIALPFEGSIPEMYVDARESGAWIMTESWVKPPMYLRIGSGIKTTDLNLIPKPTFDYSDLESIEVKAPASDGTMIPLSIVYKHGLQKDGAHPTFLTGYGSYGITLDPAFGARFIPWLERGGIWAVSHLRGGGEYGEDWHNAGRKLTKTNTITDFIACAEYLVKNNYTSSLHLAGEGGSAGGITVGGALTQRPDLFAAILDDVGVSDALRAETSANGPPNIPEFGSTKSEEGFKGLYAMDAYVHVKDGTAYPAVMLTTGINDPRVDSWEAAKMTARLQAATSSSKPILLRVDYDAGHGFGSGRAQRDQLLSDELSFALWQFGDPQFQPKMQTKTTSAGK